MPNEDGPGDPIAPDSVSDSADPETADSNNTFEFESDTLDSNLQIPTEADEPSAVNAAREPLDDSHDGTNSYALEDENLDMAAGSDKEKSKSIFKRKDKATRKKPTIELQPLDTPGPRGNMSMVTLTGQSLGSTPPKQGSGALGNRGLVSPPFHRRPRFVLWLLLLACLVIASPACLIELGRPDVADADEAVALATLAETYTRNQGVGPVKGLTLIENLVPYLHGRPLDQPPALTWLQLGAIHLSFDPPTSPYEFILHARILSYVLAMLTICCIFWAGHCIGGHRTALFAGMLAAVNPLLIHYARLATPTIALTALTMLAIASALWAIRPLRTSPSVMRQGLGWATCGLAMSAAAFTIGVGAAPIIILPILLILLLCPNRISHLMGVIAAMLITALTIVSWIAFSQAYSLGLPWWWSTQAFKYFWLDQGWVKIGTLAWQTPLLVLVAMLPWSLWVLGAIIQPFSSSSAGTRTRMFLSWAWFVLMFALLLVLPTTTPGASLMVAMAAACVMIGQLFNQYIDLANAGRYARFWRLLRWPHLLVIALASIALPVWLYFQPQLIERFEIHHHLMLTPAKWLSVSLGIVLLTITAFSVRWAVDNYPARALVAWTTWTLVVVVTLVTLWTRSPSVEMPVVKKGQELHKLIGNSPVYWVQTQSPDASLTFYGQIYPAPIALNQLAEVRREQAQFYLLASAEVPITAGPHMKLLTTLPGNMGLWRVQGQSLESSTQTTLPSQSIRITPKKSISANTIKAAPIREKSPDNQPIKQP